MPSRLTFGFAEQIDEHALYYRSGTPQSQINRLKVVMSSVFRRWARNLFP